MRMDPLLGAIALLGSLKGTPETKAMRARQKAREITPEMMQAYRRSRVLTHRRKVRWQDQHAKAMNHEARKRSKKTLGRKR